MRHFLFLYGIATVGQVFAYRAAAFIQHDIDSIRQRFHKEGSLNYRRA